VAASLTQGLQSLELASTAEIHLYKTLLKINTIASAPALPHYAHTTVGSPRRQLDGPTANVQARLFKSSPVQEAIGKALSGVRAILGIEEVKAVKNKRLRAKDYAEGVLDKDIRPNPVRKVEKPSLRAGRSVEEQDGSPNKGDFLRDQQPEHSEASEDDYDKYALRLAASSDEGSRSGQSESEELHEGDLNPKSIPEDDAPAEGISSESEAEAKPGKPKKPPSAPPNSTTFLPSLSMGYFSGSEAAEDLSDEGPKGRKNRMGQQARRVLWEKKFGKNANHVKKQPQNRDEGWDARKGASAGDDRGRRGRCRGGGDTSPTAGRDKAKSSRGSMSSGANSDLVNARNVKLMVLKQTKPAADAPLHPSWEAAKRAKEQKKPVAFRGKKVIFD